MGPLKNEAGEVRASTRTARHYGYAMQIFLYRKRHMTKERNK
ncbi:hypothetical protein DFO78_104309 [Bacillus subtilis]|nr:hypothetical protein DFO78_104309 [Bacillus subtilis]